MKAHLKGLLENQERKAYVGDPPPQLIMKTREFWDGEWAADRDISPYSKDNRHFAYQYTIPATTKYDEPVAMYQEIPRETAENMRKLRENEDIAMQALATRHAQQKIVDDISKAVEKHKKDRYYAWDTESRLEELSKDWKPYEGENPYKYLERLYRKIYPPPAAQTQPAPALPDNLVNSTNGYAYTQIVGYTQGVQRDIRPDPLVVPPVGEIPKIPEPAEPKKRMMRK